MAVGRAGAGRATDRLFALYMLVSGVALAFPHRGAAWPILLAVHVGAAAFALRLPPFGRIAQALRARWPRAASIAGDWYPLALVPLLYAELVPLNLAVWGARYFDPVIQGVEAALFGGQPSRALAAAAPWLPLSEALHGAYLSYYFVIYGPPLILFLQGRREEFRQVVFGVMLVFFAHYLFFIYFPVQGPRYVFPAPDGPIAAGPLYKLAHAVLEAGSSQGAAFPSSHVGVAFAQTALAVRFLPRLAPWLAVLSAGLAVGAVYGGFHYATDAIAGLLLGLLVVGMAPAAARLASRG
ncbi:MAG TPA: phosphatase PAP2 family protein [Longimicrobiales bacterium]